MKKKVKKIKKGIQGSFLLEALLSVLILSVSLTLIIQAMTASLRSSSFSTDYTRAIILIENKMNEFIQQGYVGVSLNEPTPFPEPDEQFSYALSSAPIEDVPGVIHSDELKNNLNNVSLEVSWESGQRVNQLEINTLLFKNQE